jgi:hypothetical protein
MPPDPALLNSGVRGFGTVVDDTNVVHVPNYVVSALLPEAIFDGD